MHMQHQAGIMPSEGGGPVLLQHITPSMAVALMRHMQDRSVELLWQDATNVVDKVLPKRNLARYAALTLHLLAHDLTKIASGTTKSCAPAVRKGLDRPSALVMLAAVS